MRCSTYRSGKRVYWCHTGRDRAEIGLARCEIKVNARELEGAVGHHLTIILSDQRQLRSAIRDYLRQLDSQIEELETSSLPSAELAPGIVTSLKRANKLYVDGKIEEEEHRNITSPLQEKLQTLRSGGSGPYASLKQLADFRQQRAAIERALEDESLLAHISGINGLRLLKRRSEAEQADFVRTNGRPKGVTGIDALLNEAVLGEVSFRQLLNLLALNATVGAEQIRVEGLIPVDFPTPEIEDFPIRFRSSKGEFQRLVALEEFSPARFHSLADAPAADEAQPVLVMVEVGR
ncbi:MAG: hypothetical protein O3A47_00545 [Chloroflexi bacterium]|nr:hypothetical protein [Chloroflexota bacterium]